jgi:RimJ/RimL family protein N-acetyltransferase
MRGRGLAAPLVALVIREAFNLPEIERLELNVFPFNASAIRTYEGLGFVKEGVRRSSARVGAKRWDTAIMALLRADWRPGTHE